MSSLDDPRLPPEGTLLGGRYRLRRYLAQGGMGAVYEAEDQTSGQRVAVKVMLDTSTAARESGAWARFLREAEVTSSLSSPHLVKVYGGGIDPDLGIAYLVMEFLVGEDLDALLERVGALHPQVAVRLIVQAAKGLVVAHEAGVVHRDLKPANLFLEIKEGEVMVKVCDFGIAKIRPQQDQQNLTGTGHVLGSPMYMAPEQLLSSKRVDHRADVWSLAMTLFHALAGRAPLAHLESFTELLVALSTRPIPSLQDAAPWTTPGLASVVHGALLRDPETRCPSVADLLRALELHTGGSDEVTAGMLTGLAGDQRKQRQLEATLPGNWSEAIAQNRAVADPLIGKSLAGKYTLVRALGEGGMGAVYEGHTASEEAFACKVIRPDLVGASPDAMRRLMREARTSMRLLSPHVVHVVEADTDMNLGVPFIVMELLRGLDLAALVSSQGPLAPAATCRLFLDACEGLSVAHQEGVVHRDIKPANLFLHQVGSSAEPLVVKVCDFGIAKQTDSDSGQSTELTRTGGLLGSPMYMSPEQAKNAKRVDHRTDIWSLAITMYEALAGQKAWNGFNSPGELVLAICTQEVPPLQDLAPWIGPDLADAIHRGLRRDPAERYASIDEFARAIAPHAASCPTLTLDALRSLSSHERQIIAERSPHSRRSTAPGATSVDSTRDVELVPRRPPASPLPRLAAGLAVVAMAGAIGVWMFRSPAPRDLPASALVPPPPTAEPSATAPPPKVALVNVVQIPVSPPGVRVLINDRPVPVNNGMIDLSGVPGDSFPIVLELDGARREHSVTLTRDGKANPASLEGPTRAAKLDPKLAAGSARTPAAKPTGTATAAAPTATGMGPQKDWR